MRAKYIKVANVAFGKGDLVVQQEDFVGTDAYEDGNVPEPAYERFLKYCDEKGETLCAFLCNKM